MDIVINLIVFYKVCTLLFAFFLSIISALLLADSKDKMDIFELICALVLIMVTIVVIFMVFV